MSVNAINAAEPQQKGNPMASALATGVGLGAVAGGVGYYVGNKRPDLDKVFAMPKDKFEAATKEAAEDLKDDVKKIAAGRKVYADAIEEKRKPLANARKAKVDLVKSQTPDNIDELNKKIADAEDAIKAKEVGENKLTKTAVDAEQETARENYRKAEKVVKDAGENATEEQKNALTDAENKLKEANKKSKEFYNGASEEVTKLRNAKKELANAKRAKVAEAEMTKATTDIQEAKKALIDAKTSKLNELTGKQEYKDAFAKIQKLFPKEGGKKIGLIAAGVAAAIGLIGGYIMGNKQA